MRRAALVLALTLLALPACRTTHPFYSAAPGSEMARTELYFGSLHDGQEIVTDEEWQKFLAEVVTPRFPAGLTVLTGRGQWMGAKGLVKEESRVLVLLHAGTPAEEQAIQEIREIFKERFQQRSVLRVTSTAKVAF